MSPTTTSAVLKALTDSILDKPPYVSGMLPLPLEYFHLYYRTADSPNHLNLATATGTQLDELAAACEPATFGRNKEDVLDESYRKAGKMNTDHFSSPIVPERTELMRAIRDELLEGNNSSRPIKVELYKLNVYGKGSFFRAHVDTPRGGSMFGSLVLVLPTPHEGGSLILRHHGEEWSVDSGKAVAGADPAVAFVAFYSDVEHEVSLVKSGHRVTLTYNLYYDDMKMKDKPSPSGAAASIIAANETLFKTALCNALCDASFLPKGGLLGFALRHKYPVVDTSSLKQLPALLKGSDAVIWRTCKEFSLKTSVYFSCVDDDEDRSGWIRVVFDYYPGFGDDPVEIDEGGIIGSFLREGSATVIETSSHQFEDSQASSDDEKNDEDGKHGHEQEDGQDASDVTEDKGGIEWGPVIWVTRDQESRTSVQEPYLPYGNETTIDYCYATVCLFVDFPNVDERMEKGFVEGGNDST